MHPKSMSLLMAAGACLAIAGYFAFPIYHGMMGIMIRLYLVGAWVFGAIAVITWNRHPTT